MIAPQRHRSFGTVLLIALAAAATIGLARTTAGRAQTEAPPPPTIALDAPRFDAARNMYLLDMVYTRPDAIGTLQISLVSPEGVEVLRVGVERQGRNQSVEVDAGVLQAGQNYIVEVKAFDPSGSPIVGSNSGALLATREFTHLPGRARLGDPRFKLDPARSQLVIEVEVSSSQTVTAYRVVFEDKNTAAVVLDTRLPAPPPLAVPLNTVVAGEYTVTIIALDAAEQPMTQVADEFVYQTGATTLGNPLFEYQAEPPALVVRLQPANALPIERLTISLINKATNQVALDYEAPAEAQAGGGVQIAVPVDDLPAGTYLVLVRALDASGQELASVEGETAYTPPPPPRLTRRILDALAANMWIPILIVVVLLAAIGAILLYARWERRATATPMLQGWGAAGVKASPLPLSRTMIHDPNATPIVSQPGAALPDLRLIVVSSPDKRQNGKRIKLENFPFTLGRTDCDLSFPGDDHISRRHAELHHDDRGLAIVDRLSSNGTYVNGERIASDKPVTLDISRPVRIQLGRETQLVIEPVDRR